MVIKYWMGKNSQLRKRKMPIKKNEPINLIIEEIKEVCFEDGELN